MLDFFEKVGDQLKEAFEGWPTFIAVGTFLLYLTGYLSTRYYLTVLGVGADLAVLDEQYLFAGARFIVYLVSTLPILLLFALPVVLVAWALRKAFRSLLKRRPKKRWLRVIRIRSRGISRSISKRISRFLSSPRKVSIIGILVALLLVQIIMRKCFLLHNLLVAKELPETGLGLEQLLLDTDDYRTSRFFMSLVIGTMLTAGLWMHAKRLEVTDSISKIAVSILGCLVLIQFLFLPINYGVYVQGRFLPRVADLGDQVPLRQGQNAWLVWEGPNSFTYLVEEPRTKPEESKPTVPQVSAPITPTSLVDASTNGVGQAPPSTAPSPTTQFGRKLVSIPQKDSKQIVIVKYDPIMSHLFLPKPKDD